MEKMTMWIYAQATTGKARLPRACIFFAASLLLAGLGCVAANDKPADVLAASGTEKMDAGLQMEIHRQRAEQPDREIAVLLRTRKEINAAERTLLESKGVKIGSVLGDIATARIPANAIADIAALEFVVFIEIAKRQQLR